MCPFCACTPSLLFNHSSQAISKSFFCEALNTCNFVQIVLHSLTSIFRDEFPSIISPPRTIHAGINIIILAISLRHILYNISTILICFSFNFTGHKTAVLLAMVLCSQACCVRASLQRLFPYVDLLSQVHFSCSWTEVSP